MSDRFQYPCDEVMCKALGEALKQARLKAGLSLEEAEKLSRIAMERLDRKRISRALGLAIKEAREKRHVSRDELSRSAGLPLRRLIALERGLAADMPVTEFFRICYALKIKPDELSGRFEEIEKNIAQGRPDTVNWKRLAVWNATDGRLLLTLQGHNDRVWQALFSPDGRRIVTASSDRTARIWNAADGRMVAILRGHTDVVPKAQFSPDGGRIVTASFDNTGRLWNSADGSLLATLQGHTEQLSGAQFSPDGQRIVTVSSDTTARVWSNTGCLIATLQGHSNEVRYAQFSPDGQRIVTTSADQTARIWQILTLDDINRILAR